MLRYVYAWSLIYTACALLAVIHTLSAYLHWFLQFTCIVSATFTLVVGINTVIATIRGTDEASQD